MKRILLSPKAKSDLSNIWDYSLDRWGAEKAEDYLRTLWKNLQECTDNPDITVRSDLVRKGYRKMISGNHVIYFKEIEDGINVIRTLHQRIDFRGKV